MRVWTWDSLPQAKLYIKKSHKGVYPLLGKFIPKITNFGDFGGCMPIF